MYKNLIFILSLIFLWNCTSQVYKPLPKTFATQERISKAKGFAEEFIKKCNTKEYSEIEGYNIDASAKRRHFTMAKLEETCTKLTARTGHISVGEYHSAITYSRPANYSDLFVFNAKSEKNDSVKYVVVGLYRDQDFVSGIRLADRPAPKINIRIR